MIKMVASNLDVFLILRSEAWLMISDCRIMWVLTSCHQRTLEHPGCQGGVGEEQEAEAAQEPVGGDLWLALIG